MKSNPAYNDELFFKVTRTALVDLCKLKYSEFKIYLYLKTKDPYGNAYQEIDFEDLTEVTGVKSLGSIYPALSRLHNLGFIKWYVAKSYAHVMDQSTDPKITRVIQRSAERSQDQPTDLEISALKNQPSKGSPGKRLRRSKNLKNLKNDQNEIKKREGVDFEADPGFEEWIDRGIDSLPKPPAGVYRQKLKRKELENPANYQEYLQLKAEHSRRGSEGSAKNSNVEKIVEELPLDGDEYLRRLQARMLGGNDAG